MKQLLSARWPSLFLLSIAFLLLYNSFTTFPFTFLVIIVYVLLTTYLQNGNLKNLQFKKFRLPDLKIILVVYVMLEWSMDLFIQPAINKLCNEPADYSSFHQLKGNGILYVRWLIGVWISAALGEELLFRAYTFAQLKNIFGDRRLLIVLLSAVLFCIPHLYQGIAGLIITFIWGIAFGTLYLMRQHIWINIIVHGLVDTAFLTVCYFGHSDWYNITR